ncbi:short-chain dehydrogenase/reductase GME11361 [Cryptomeria japonica]|uniref:short-chain dehydrogenase/reductase GME11361 n=1 Tax=Cryptomeria japonica TaxID=3369 RepID=UPI0027DA5117|nr:short-chain dehydrogenase/reductase GME11361 [Cryptomeria japonica]
MAETETGAGAGAGKEVVLVTGCTPGGIGHAMAMEFAHMKCQVVATARSFSSLEALRTNAQVALHTVQLDVLSETSIEEAVRTVMDMYGRIDILVNNAGVHSVGPLAELPMELLQSTFNTNVFGTMQVIKAVVPHMASRRKGKIVNIGSVSVLVCNPWAGAYAASKAALHCLSDSLRVELKPFGIDVITVVPGAIKSNLGYNSSTIYSNLPEWRLYKPFEKAIRERIDIFQKNDCTPTNVFAKKTVDILLRRKSPPWFSYGQFSIITSIMYYLPICLRDFIARRVYKVSTLENVKDK